MRHNIRVRFDLTRIIRRHLEDRGFWELETPILYKSTPEGAREFLVPTSSHPGRFYALPQSPQTYKQLYVISGFERYYQIARCFRDEATRADRTAEFTQLDLEMGFVEPDELHELMEGLFQTVWREVAGIELEIPFPRLTHAEATLRYASDKPDTRFGCEIADVTDALRGTEFKAFRGVVDSGGVVRGFAVPGALDFSRKDFDDLVEFARTWGGKGVAWLQLQGGEIRSPIAKFLAPAELDADRGRRRGEATATRSCSSPTSEEAAVRVLGPLRLHLGERLGLVRDGWNFLWVTGFPMFEWLPDEDRWKASHNPFSAPEPEDEADFEQRPRERAGAPVRPRPERQRGRRRLDPQPPARGAEPHLRHARDERARRPRPSSRFSCARCAWGRRRTAASRSGSTGWRCSSPTPQSIRDVTAFPKGQGGGDPLTGRRPGDRGRASPVRHPGG